MMKRARCDKCAAPVIWVRHVDTQRAAKIDAQPAADGNIMLHDDGEHYQILSGELLASARNREWPLYINHRGSCSALKGGKLSFDEGDVL